MQQSAQRENNDTVTGLYHRAAVDKHSDTVAHQSGDSHALRQPQIAYWKPHDLGLGMSHQLGDFGIGQRQTFGR